MTKIFTVTLVAITASALLVGCQNINAPLEGVADPAEVVTPIHQEIAEHDFGEIEQGDDVSHVFTLLNETGTTVAFTQPPLVEMGCCITAEMNKENVEPGQTAELKVTYRTRLKPGPFSWGVKLFPTNQDFPNEFRIHGQVKNSLVVDPIQLNFSQAGDLDFQVTGIGLGETHKITKVSTNSPNLSVQLVDEKEDRESNIFTYRVRWNGKSLVQKSTPVIYVMTDSPKLQWFPVLIYGGTNYAK